MWVCLEIGYLQIHWLIILVLYVRYEKHYFYYLIGDIFTVFRNPEVSKPQGYPQIIKGLKKTMVTGDP